MRRTDEFYEEEERCHKANILIAALAIFTLMLTGVIFASKTDAGTEGTTDIRTTDAYAAEETVQE